MKKSLALSLLFISSQGLAAPQSIDLATFEKQLKAINVFDLDPAKPVPRKGGLLELKWKQLRKQYAPCRAQAAKLIGREKDVAGWVALVWLDCATQPKAASDAQLAAAFQGVRPYLGEDAPWSSPLRRAWVDAGFLLVSKLKAKPAEAQRHLETILSEADLSSAERGKAWAEMGNIALAKQRDEEALFYFRQAKDADSDQNLSSKIEDLEARRIGPKPPTPPAEPEVGAESEAEQQIQALWAKGNRVDAAQLIVVNLNRFPAGRYSKRWRGRIQEALTGAPNDQELAKILDAAKEADPTIMAEWAGLLHRRFEDRAALELAEKALETHSSSNLATTLLYIAGRAASFLDESDRAARHFDRLVQYHSSTDEASEALFRMGLIELRKGHGPIAAKLFDKLIAMNKSRWDLSSRYWRIRALESTDKATAAKYRDELIDRWPFTYYGLRLKAERDNGVVEFGKNDRSPLEARKATIWLVGSQKKFWERFRKLSEEGWILEAQSELAQLPLPAEPRSQLSWARVLSKAAQFPVAISLVNKATEFETSLRHPRYLDAVYPKAYSRWIDKEAQEDGLDPALIRGLIRQESAFGLKAVSTSSAMGLMQMIPPTAKEIAGEMKLNVVIPDDMFRPEVNVPMGTHYVSKMLREFDANVPMALAGYNAGPHRIKKWISQRPSLQGLMGRDFTSWQDEIWYDELPWSETSFYVKAILRNVLIDRLVDKGRVAITPSFWSDLRKPRSPASIRRSKQR